MAAYAPDSLVTVRPFSHRRDGDTVVIGDVDRQVFLAIPAEGLDILDSLAAGSTVAEAARGYQEKYGETADIEDFLEALAAEGFVAAPSGQTAETLGDDGARAVEESVPRNEHWRFRMEWLTQRTAQRLVSRPVLALGCLIIAGGVGLVIDDPSIMPRVPQALLFPIDFSALTWATVGIALIAVALHEVGHVVAARAAGIPAGIGIGNQLYVLVAQTDMTGIWLAPKKQRYVAFVIGSIIDGVSCSFLAAFLWAAHHAWITVPRWSTLLATALILTYLTRIAWQCFFFLRTDGYYVIATAFKCKNLLADTEDFLRNQVARVFRRPRPVDQSAIPAREMRVIRWYSGIWFLGRFFAISVFATAGIPVLWGYVYQVILLVTGGHTRFGSIDFITVAVLTLSLDGGGLVMWVVNMYRGARDRRRERLAAGAGKSPVAGVEAASEAAGVA